MVLTPEEIDQYRRDGYLILTRPVLGREAVKEAAVRVDKIFAEWPAYSKRRLTGNIRSSDDSPGVSGIKGAATLNRELARIPLLRTCRNVASELLGGRRTWFFFDHVVSKDSGEETEVQWHQDFAYSTTGLIRDSVHFWVPLQDIDASHGSMVYLPGSHLTGLQDHEPLSRSGETILSATVEDDGVEVPPVQMGGLVCHDPMTLHYSKSNHSGGVRRAWVLHFGAGPWPAIRHMSNPMLMAISSVQNRVRN